MGMFDKDKEVGLLLTRWVEKREEFIIWNASIVRDDYPTELGPTAQAAMAVSRMDDPQNQYTVTTLASAIADKVREADPADFPAVVYWTTAPSRFGKQEATVLQFVKAYDRATFRTRAAAADTEDPDPIVPPAE